MAAFNASLIALKASTGPIISTQFVFEGHIIGAGFDSQLEDLIRVIFTQLKTKISDALELPAHRTGFRHVAARAVEHVADFGHGAVAVIGNNRDQHRHAVRAIAFVQ